MAFHAELKNIINIYNALIKEMVHLLISQTDLVNDE